jgi:antitoxin ChpS
MAIFVPVKKVIAEPVRPHAVSRLRRPKYTLDALLVGSNPDAPMSEEERAWQDAPPAGRETW